MKKGVEKMVGKRKESSDKKITIAPFLDPEFYDFISRLAYVLEKPLKDIGEILIIEGLKSKEVIEQLSIFFKRDFTLNSSLYLGDKQKEMISNKTSTESKQRLYIRLKQETHEQLSLFVFALDLPKAPAAALLLETILKTKKAFYPILSRYVQKDLDESRIKQLRYLCKYVDKNTLDEHVTLTLLLSHIMKECMEQSKTITQRVKEFFN